MKKNKENVYHDKERCENVNVKEFILCLHKRQKIIVLNF